MVIMLILKAFIDGMQLSNIPVPFNTDLLERLNKVFMQKILEIGHLKVLTGKNFRSTKTLKTVPMRSTEW